MSAPGACLQKKMNGVMCGQNYECVSDYCGGSGVCAANTCTDGAMNGTETDVDCGRSCATKCANGKACVDNSDCANGNCKRSLCVNALCNNGSLDGGNGETAIDCGGPNCQICPTLLVLTTQGPTSPYNVQYGIFNGTTWSGTTLAGTAVGTPSLAIAKTRYAIGVVRTGSDTLASYKWLGTTNGWSTPIWMVAPKADGIPDASAFGPYVELAFRNQGDASKYYTARYNGSSWDAMLQQTGAPDGTVNDLDFFHRDAYGTAMLTYPDETTSDPFTQIRTNGSWSAATAAFATTASTAFAPNVVQLSNGDLLMTYVKTDDFNKVYWSKFAGGSWSTPAEARDNNVPDRIRTTIRPGLVVMPNGNVILIYANSADSGKLYAAIYDTTANAWNTPVANVTGAAVSSIVAVPALSDSYGVEVLCNEGTPMTTMRHFRRQSGGAWETLNPIGISTANVQSIAAASFR